ncbi:hypothetical protein ACQ86G_19155 [Roseateles chitinivorans]|uniref:hypothetical protein n=1 Tax=Roseateles chitinivorans TaxID=2917965 RepID=UPI003D66A8C0
MTVLRQLLVSATLLLAASAEAAPCNASTPEDFAAFFGPFSTDQRFAADRTTFPLRTVRWTYGADKAGADASAPTVRSTSKAEFMRWKTIAALEKQGPLTHRLKPSSTEDMEVELFKDGSDIEMSYRFTRREGCWRFVQFEDRSL